MIEKKKKYAYWMYPSMVAEIENALDDADVNSKGEFVCRAVEFYLGYLRSRKDVDYLAPILGGAIKSEVRSLETHLSEMLFKLAVESAKVNHLLASQSEVSDEYMERLNRMCCRDVAGNNGCVTFEDAYSFQHSEEEDEY